MELLQALQIYEGHPITHQLLISLLKNYKRPNDKIHELVKAGLLESVKRGIYVLGPKFNSNRVSPLLMGNHLLGPSYISLDTALSFYGFIPERVYNISSMTTKSSRKFSTSLGVFEYIKSSLPYYGFGITQHLIDKDKRILIATPEKALCDKIITTKGIQLKSKKSTLHYLRDDLRIPEYQLKNLDLKSIDPWIAYSPKKETLKTLLTTLQKL